MSAADILTYNAPDQSRRSGCAASDSVVRCTSGFEKPLGRIQLISPGHLSPTAETTVTVKMKGLPSGSTDPYPVAAYVSDNVKLYGASRGWPFVSQGLTYQGFHQWKTADDMRTNIYGYVTRSAQFVDVAYTAQDDVTLVFSISPSRHDLTIITPGGSKAAHTNSQHPTLDANKGLALVLGILEPAFGAYGEVTNPFSWGSFEVCVQGTACLGCSTGFVKVPGTACLSLACQPCASCPANQYKTGGCSDGFTDTVCAPCASCAAGQYIGTLCSADGNTQCLPCPSCAAQPNTYLSAACTGTEQTPPTCLPCRECAAGTFKSGGCTAGISDTVCSTCRAQCSTGSYETTACTPTSDRVCTPCAPGCSTYELQACTASTNRQCASSCSQCPSGKFRSGGCNGVIDSQCSTCSTCAAGRYRNGGCSATLDTTCADCRSACTPGLEYESTTCTPTSNRVCSACSACPSGHFRAGGCDGVHDSVCLPCASSCPSGSFISSECTATANTSCSTCSCPTGQHAVGGCSGSQNSECAVCGCPSGQFATGSACLPGGTFANCTACRSCGPDEFLVSSCTATADTVCKACRSCVAGESYTSVACTSTSDTQCTPCTQGCPSGYEVDQACTPSADLLCKDVDECKAQSSPCPAHATCNNTVGAFTCTCHAGFAKTPTGHCQDVDECAAAAAANTSLCHQAAACLNLPGSFNCTCGAGFVGTGFECTAAAAAAGSSSSSSGGAAVIAGAAGAGVLLLLVVLVLVVVLKRRQRTTTMVMPAAGEHDSGGSFSASCAGTGSGMVLLGGAGRSTAGFADASIASKVDSGRALWISQLPNLSTDDDYNAAAPGSAAATGQKPNYEVPELHYSTLGGVPVGISTTYVDAEGYQEPVLLADQARMRQQGRDGSGSGQDDQQPQYQYVQSTIGGTTYSIAMDTGSSTDYCVAASGTASDEVYDNVDADSAAPYVSCSTTAGQSSSSGGSSGGGGGDMYGEESQGYDLMG